MNVDNSEVQEIQNENSNIKKKKGGLGGSQKKSWVWNWFETNETGAICQVEITAGVFCNKHYKNENSTGNLINHLINKHHIIEETKKQDLVVRKKL